MSDQSDSHAGGTPHGDSHAEKRDVAWVKQLEPERFGVVRYRENRIEIGELQPLKEGREIHGEVVRLHARDDALHDVEVLMDAPRRRAPEQGRDDGDREKLGDPSRSGPAQFATRAYRDNWDAIFKSRKADLPN